MFFYRAIQKQLGFAASICHNLPFKCPFMTKYKYGGKGLCRQRNTKHTPTSHAKDTHTHTYTHTLHNSYIYQLKIQPVYHYKVCILAEDPKFLTMKCIWTKLSPFMDCANHRCSHYRFCLNRFISNFTFLHILASVKHSAYDNNYAMQFD